MRKVIFLITGIVLFYMLLGHVSSYVIPEDALRVRIIANSNSEYDQYVKGQVKENIQYELYDLLNEAKTVDQAREIVQNHLNDIDSLVDMTLKKENYPFSYKIHYGMNYFPAKEYKGTIYEEGYYESLVVTLGEGNGDNWWCVLFPPLCLLEAEESDHVEYTSLVKEMMNKYR